METYWTYNDVRLDSLGAVTLQDEYLDIPMRRGDNVVIPMQEGRLFVPKRLDQRVLNFGLEVTGSDLVDLEAKIDVVKALLMRETYLPNYLRMYRVGFQKQFWAFAEIQGQLGITRDGTALSAKFVIPFVLRDPTWYYDNALTTVLDWTTAGAPITNTVNNPGNVNARKKIYIEFFGPGTNLYLLNNTLGIFVGYAGVLAVGHKVNIGVENFTATEGPVGGPYTNCIGSLSHGSLGSGLVETAFFAIGPGANEYVFGDDVNVGSRCYLRYYPAYV